jgi:hypothetical protein
MKRIIYIAAIAVLVSMLTGCIDVLHYIGRDGDGRPMAVVKLTFEKAIFEWAAQMGGEDMPTTDEEFAEEFDISEEEVTAELPEGMDINYSTVNTPMDFGFQLDITRQPGTPEDAELPWLPSRAADGTLTIPLPEQDSEEAGGEQEQAFLSSAKYRLIIARDICPENPVFSLEGLPQDKTMEPDVLALPEVYVVEFPLMLWLGSSGTRSVVAEASGG